MATAIKKKAPKKAAHPVAIYLYGISLPAKRTVAIRAEAVDGVATIEAVRVGGFSCWISRVERSEYADHLAENMENLDWLATIGVRHQRAVADLALKVELLPARFGTVFLSEESLAGHIENDKKSIQSVFKKIAGADEWGVKVFRATQSKAPAMIEASSGTDYLKRKAQSVMPRKKKEEDPALSEFVSALSKVSADFAPGGKASAGQPNLAWHGSFLVRRAQQKKFSAALKKHTATLGGSYRVECSGPWPPYSFVGQHG
jgi:Gas vesicle synthesis protein GvpL/GvpF